MEIVDRGEGSGREPVQVAYAETGEEGELVRGLLEEEGIDSISRMAGAGIRSGITPSGPPIGGPCRIFVRPEDAARARELLGETMVEEPVEDEIPEPVNARHLANAQGHKPRDYHAFGALLRFYVVAIVVIGLVLLVFVLTHS